MSNATRPKAPIRCRLAHTCAPAPVAAAFQRWSGRARRPAAPTFVGRSQLLRKTALSASVHRAEQVPARLKKRWQGEQAGGGQHRRRLLQNEGWGSNDARRARGILQTGYKYKVRPPLTPPTPRPALLGHHNLEGRRHLRVHLEGGSVRPQLRKGRGKVIRAELNIDVRGWGGEHLRVRCAAGMGAAQAGVGGFPFFVCWKGKRTSLISGRVMAFLSISWLVCFLIASATSASAVRQREGREGEMTQSSSARKSHGCTLLAGRSAAKGIRRDKDGLKKEGRRAGPALRWADAQAGLHVAQQPTADDAPVTEPKMRLSSPTVFLITNFPIIDRAWESALASSRTLRAAASSAARFTLIALHPPH